MEFYNSWLSIGEPDKRIPDNYDHVQLQEAESTSPREPVDSPSGNFCRYSNRYRNSNFFSDIAIQDDKKLEIVKISDSYVYSAYSWQDKLVAEHEAVWSLYSGSNEQPLITEKRMNNESSLFCDDTSLFMINDLLEEYNMEGIKQKKIWILLADKLSFHDVVKVNEKTIFSGFMTYPLIPKGYRPFAFLQSFSDDGLSEPDEDSQIIEIENPSLVAFYEENNSIPVYLDECIVQGTSNGIVIFSYDLSILKIIENVPRILFLSAGPDSVLYIAGTLDNEFILSAFTLDGYLLFNTTVPAYIGQPVCPPMVSSDNTVYWVSNTHICSFSDGGSIQWINTIPSTDYTRTYPILYNDIITVCNGQNILLYNHDGENVFNDFSPKETITTPLLKIQEDSFCIGTINGLYKLLFTEK
jgi:hypothetical protein